MKRIEVLAAMAGKKPDRIIRDVWEGRQNREKAREFPQVHLALRDAGRKRPVDPGHENTCPRCRVPLAETFYEGIAVKLCPRCRGKLVDEGMMDRVIARKEVAFSEGLIRKAMDFKERFLSQPVKTRKISESRVRRQSKIFSSA
jgi:Zn-finger nucleic acid-binding protein